MISVFKFNTLYSRTPYNDMSIKIVPIFICSLVLWKVKFYRYVISRSDYILYIGILFSFFLLPFSNMFSCFFSICRKKKRNLSSALRILGKPCAFWGVTRKNKTSKENPNARKDKSHDVNYNY
jgi:hypothetical protein